MRSAAILPLKMWKTDVEMAVFAIKEEGGQSDKRTEAFKGIKGIKAITLLNAL